MQELTEVPFGNGRLCIDGAAGPLVRLAPAALIPPSGQSHYDFDQTTIWHHLLEPGSTWNFQFIYTDSVGAGINSTDAMHVTFGSE